MKPWNQRPPEEAYLFNPAFCCNILTSSIVGYMEFNNNKGMPFPLSFIILPIILHRPTRNSLPDLRTSLAPWILKHQESRILFPERTISLKPITKEALLFGFSHKWIQLDENSNLKSNEKSKVNESMRKLKGDAYNCIKTSRFLGRWFAKAGPAQNIMTMWGVRP
ncbi:MULTISPECIES: three component ABC system middle component [Methanobacterium]|uniref:Uncharacterized protein n=1 Tax=Methanobacterium bryantii TaxID=2161 RepID=A0A2A2H339_METBR|nr:MULTISPECIES: three component ABC system middle component [Methanobacterium]OEC87661.1 hypothetical protein A9507_00165 [Methanobacterium sp. A39]PAV03703.1 hypothetical protein ASJ80_01685 [Methanobacterium bryantii]